MTIMGMPPALKERKDGYFWQNQNPASEEKEEDKE